jgi:predicted dehydrogenase
MALDMTPEQKTIGKANFNRAIGSLAAADADAATRGISRRRFMKGLVAAGAVAPVGAAAYFGFAREHFGNGGHRAVRAGLIGAGDEGGVLIGEHNPQYLQFIAYSDIRKSNQRRIFEDERVSKPASPRKGFKFHYGNDARQHIRLYEDYRELLANPEIEAVVIALPLNLHAPVAIEAMRAGKHVLCEKLMARNIAQCKDMIRVANETNMVLSIGHQRHYSMLYAYAVNIINEGVLGEVRHIRALWHRNNSRPAIVAQGQPTTERVNGRSIPLYRDSWRPRIAAEDILSADQLERAGFHSMEELVRWRLYHRTGGGLMAELGSHQLDACSIFLGKVHPIAVSGVGGKYFYRDDREVEDHVFCTFEFPGKHYFAEGGHRVNDPEDKVIVTYSSISTNDFEPYGECVMGNQGTLVVEGEQSAMLFGGAGRSTAVAVTSSAGGPPVLSGASEAPAAVNAANTGQAALGGPISRGYREEMEHFAYVIRMRAEASGPDRQNLEVRCPGRNAMADAIVALTSNHAMRRHERIEFKPEWFDPNSSEVPDGLERTMQG